MACRRRRLEHCFFHPRPAPALPKRVGARVAKRPGSLGLVRRSRIGVGSRTTCTGHSIADNFMRAQNFVSRYGPELTAAWGSGNIAIYVMRSGTGSGPAAWVHGLLPDYHSFRGSYGGYAFPLWDRRRGPTAHNLRPDLLDGLAAAYGRPCRSRTGFRRRRSAAVGNVPTAAVSPGIWRKRSPTCRFPSVPLSLPTPYASAGKSARWKPSRVSPRRRIGPRGWSVVLTA